MDVADIQNLSDVASELVQAATRSGCDLKFRLQIELDKGDKLNDEQVEEFNGILKEVSTELRL